MTKIMMCVRCVRCAVLSVVAVSLAISTWAASETVDGVTWYYSVSSGNAEIASASKAVGNLTIPSTLGQCRVTSIGDYAFCNCSGLTSVTIPVSVTRIGEQAFSGCSGLTSVMVSRKGYDLSVFPEGCRIVYVGDIDISDIRVFSGWPWKEVMVGYTIDGTTDKPISLELTAKDSVSGKTYVCKTLEGVRLTTGSHVIKWNASADCAKFKSDDVVFTARVIPLPQYCVIDLSGGMSAASYPVSTLADVPNGGWTDEYKTTKLVLRRIEAGTFKMGDVGRDGTMYDITLTKPFYMGVFEVTQKQWELVMGTRPSYFNHDDYYASRPVEQVSYDMIRGSLAGAGWPANNAVDATSFLGKLRVKTGLDFDLPTAAQWECACRAGTTTDYNNGTDRTGVDIDANMAVVGRYGFNSGYASYCYEPSYSQSSAPTKGTAIVGSYVPNAWGLYDMHGNVWELCLDWISWDGLCAATDPKGVSSGSDRVMRGGSWTSYAIFCDSYDQLDFAPSDANRGVGFRLSRTLQGQEDVTPDGAGGRADALVEASSASMSVDTTFVDGMTVAGPISIAYGSVDASGCRVTANNAEVANTTANGTVEWTPTAVTGSRFLYVSGEIFMESILRIESCTITFNANGGKSSPASVQKGKGFAYGQLPTATRTGHQFLGWYTATAGGTEVTATTIVTSDTTLYAKWTPNSYSIRFDSNGGTGSMANEPMIYDAAKSLMANGFARAGYAFAGWAASKNGDVVYADGASVANLASSGVVTLYARWVRLGANAYAMCFSANGGTKMMTPQMYVAGCVFKLPKCGFSVPDGKMRFAGWAGSNGRRYDDGMLVFNLAEPGETVTMTAIWE